MKNDTSGAARLKGEKNQRRGQSGGETMKAEDKVKIEDDEPTIAPVEAANMPRKNSTTSVSPANKVDGEETVGGDITLKLEPGKPPKLARSSSKKILTRPPQLFLDYDDATSEARRTFEVILDCSYANKYLGTTDAAYECDCNEEWGKHGYSFQLH